MKLFFVALCFFALVGCECNGPSSRQWRVECESGFDTGWMVWTSIEGGVIYWSEETGADRTRHAHVMELGDTCTDRKRTRYDVD